MSKVKIVLRFDTEDYLMKESNEALFKLLKLLEKLDIRATFPLVGEKIKFLIAEGRTDILRKLKRHSLGYHSLSHSRHPTIAERVEHSNLAEGMEIFAATEAEGFEQFCDCFDRFPACYTQPGGNWVPHAFPVLRRWQIPINFSEEWNSYLDFGSEPYFYQDILSWSDEVVAPKPFLNQLPQLEDYTKDMLLARYRYLTERGGGRILIVAHPTELVTAEYWDVVNFGRGINRPFRKPGLRSAGAVEAAMASLENILGFLQQLPQTEYVTADELIEEHNRKTVINPRAIPAQSIRAAVEKFAAGRSIGYAKIAGQWFSAAELLLILSWKALKLLGHENLNLKTTYLAGPDDDSPDELAKPLLIPAADFNNSLTQVITSCQEGRTPHAVQLAGITLRPEEYLGGLITYLAEYYKGKTFPESVMLTPVTFAPQKHLKKVEQLHWDWPVFRPDFKPANLYDVTANQLWTLKPATGD